ncbi:aldo/keto reductase [Cyclobacterium jeungdonense]|uniref:Aldo/keto reductase n=1 Tax=Cyclobacterium jeungdonense TaxID=708087 RepID=A0ABT8CA23_9BACT|nr:aldo/keto reductase [Cyclobacterium jeungdonense]MDN3689360.1 aldo/keto reductase [Cyclobacterium jeungdonense]
MNRRILGNTGIHVSELAFGGVEIGLPYGPGVRSEQDMVQEKDALSLLQNAFDSGITFYDTARMYGKSEYLIGEAFQNCREEVQICTKCRHLRDTSGKLPAPGQLVKRIRESLEESLQTLKTDYLDVLMLHQADVEILQHETICREFQDIQKEGLARAIGASTYSVAESELAIHSGIWQVVQLPYNLLDQRQAVVFDVATEKGVGLVVRSVLLRGLLSERGRNLHAALEKVEGHIRYFAELAKKYRMDLSEYATRFVLAQPQISATLVGIDRQEYLEKALETAAMDPLPTELMKGAIPFPDPDFIDIPHWDRMGWLD